MKTIWWAENFLGPIKFWDQKNFGSGKKFGVKKKFEKKKYKAKINYGLGKFFGKNCGSKKILIQKKSLKKFGSKNVGFEKNCWSDTILGTKEI